MITHITPLSKCDFCGDVYINAHYCKYQPLTQKVPWIPGPNQTVIPKTITEEDVRRIVKEEISKLRIV